VSLRAIVPIAALAGFALSQSVAAQRSAIAPAPDTFIVNVTQTPARLGGGPNDHFLTFNQRVEVPGATLVAGTYLFRLTAPTVVQVLTADRSRVYTMFMTLRADGDGDTSRERMKIQEMDDGTLRILGWYPADATGYEFLYGKPRRESIERPR
jgi:hypothetical protein